MKTFEGNEPWFQSLSLLPTDTVREQIYTEESISYFNEFLVAGM